MKEKYRKFRDRMDAFAYKMGEKQAKLFLNIFYLSVVPVAHAYLKLTKRLHHENTGHFITTSKENNVERHQKQF